MTKKVALALKVTALLAIVCGGVYLSRTVTMPTCSAVQLQLRDAGALAPLVFAAAYVLATVLLIPGTIVTMLAGLAFGIWWGTAIAAVAATIGATLAFLLARWLGKGAVERWLSKQAWYARLHRDASSNGLNYVVFMRLVPLVPFNAFNFACGVMPLRLRDYVLGSFLGMLPGTFAYAYFGVAGCGVIDSLSNGTLHVSELPQDVWIKLAVAILLLSAITLLPLWLKRRRPSIGPASK